MRTDDSDWPNMDISGPGHIFTRAHALSQNIVSNIITVNSQMNKNVITQVSNSEFFIVSGDN